MKIKKCEKEGIELDLTNGQYTLYDKQRDLYCEMIDIYRFPGISVLKFINILTGQEYRVRLGTSDGVSKYPDIDVNIEMRVDTYIPCE